MHKEDRSVGLSGVSKEESKEKKKQLFTLGGQVADRIGACDLRPKTTGCGDMP